MKKTVTILLLFLFYSISISSQTSQTPSYKWLKDFGRMDMMYPGFIAGDKGDLFAYLRRENQGGARIERYDSTGALMWSVTGPQGRIDARLPDNSIIAVGTAYNFMAIGATTIVADPAKPNMLIRIDENGNVLEYFRYKAYYTGIQHVRVNAAGETYLYGIVNDTLDIKGHLVINNKPSYRDYILKLDSQFQPMWSKIYDRNIKVMIWDFKVDKGSNIYITGTYEDTLQFGQQVLAVSPKSNKSFLMKLDPDGDIIWHKTMKGGSSAKISFDNQDLVYLGGNYTDTLTIENSRIVNPACNEHSCDNSYAAKFDQAGNLQWLTMIGHTFNSVLNSSAVSPDGRLFITGDYAGSMKVGNDSIFQIGNYDYSPYLAYLDYNGKLNWFHVPRNYHASGNALVHNNKGDIFWAGYSKRLYIGIDSVVSDQSNKYQFFVAKFNQKQAMTVIGEGEKRMSLNIFPNPSQGSFVIEHEREDLMISIYDITGSCIYCTKGKNEINLPAGYKGIFVVETSARGKTHRQKIIVQ